MVVRRKLRGGDVSWESEERGEWVMGYLEEESVGCRIRVHRGRLHRRLCMVRERKSVVWNARLGLEVSCSGRKA